MMIDRKALWLSGLIVVAMIAAALWRLSLFPEGQVAAGARGAPGAASGLVLFAAPATLLFLIALAFVLRWSEPEEARPAWRRWNGKWIVAWAALFALIQALVLAGSLGFTPESPLAMARAGLVVIGVILMTTANFLPKAPLSQRDAPLTGDLWKQNRFVRLVGRVLTGVGLVFVLGGMLAPPDLWEPIFGCVLLAAPAALFWYSIKLGREPSPQLRADDRHRPG